ncbi:MAG: hypothetical protein ABJQ69_03535 [Ekhidna sp.]
MAKKAGLKGYLDALVDKDGLKTEVKITLTDQTLMKTAMYVVGMVVVSSVAFFTIRGIVKNMESIKSTY